ncbi:hypothetical protein [Deinococcus budaensis]|uniref:Uncharacterized protein n=1 Tax=Deinococcus budaensis TaxID=1665626 RepID=A0A7W8GHE6_9DEIO|nr:hypothetical protein [Deinococcus budaensis]MBB5235528.1 hypothetical protein [Deinococcus budaensis]
MLASELSRELNVDASVVSKRLKTYCAMQGMERPLRLDEQVVGHMREVHRLLSGGTAQNTQEAVQMVLGTYVESVPPAIALDIVQRLEALENGQRLLMEQMTRMADYWEELRNRRSAAVAQRQGDGT